MYEAIKFGWIDSNILQFSNTPADIQTLNYEAIKGTYDVTAISFGLYPFIYEDYALLRTAVSFGEGYGPKLIKKKGVTLKPNFKVALSGEHTTNALIFKIAYPNARVVYKNFLDIENAVLSGEVDAGVLIHESILDFSSELCVEREIWDIWCELRGDDSLPLPLGGMALRRSLPITDAIECERVLTNAVEVANNNKKLLCKMLLERNLVRVDDKKLEIYLNLYANDNSISMSKIQIKAVDRLFELGYKHGFYGNLIISSPNLIPTEYLESRNA
ncbi:S-ribosylhomocysteine lyase [Campylobacter fetus subsp. fetus]|nr:S-ribosylhomocysteine lyase [Campylobacter fetus subsp. fetus BT 10/98]WNY79067.1 S-ribosylhomocysteine lyase [Campylobacter fetus subsp. fetus]WNY80831.1 S-ribosylhomocysteine lyase [Campylobacter fetus subsp. fetus]